MPQGGGGNPFGNMGAMMDNIKKAQAVVQVGAVASRTARLPPSLTPLVVAGRDQQFLSAFVRVLR